jgi:hypothetical protein
MKMPKKFVEVTAEFETMTNGISSWLEAYSVRSGSPMDRPRGIGRLD